MLGHQIKPNPNPKSMFRAVYSAATAYTTAPTTDGKKVNSPVFEINRGVLQGDSHYFTNILQFGSGADSSGRLHDQQPEGVSLLDTIISTLGYADDLSRSS